MAKILVVDDEKVLVKGIKFNLESEGYQVEVGYDGEEAVELARNGSFDLIILDLMMPKIDGLQACMRIREFSNVPVIMLTARSEDTDKIIGFECGADDYITKPFNILEVKARVRALLRRAGVAAQRDKNTRLTMGHIVIDSDERSAWKEGGAVVIVAPQEPIPVPGGVGGGGIGPGSRPVFRGPLRTVLRRRQGREALQHMGGEPGEPHALPPAQNAHPVHAVVPVSGPHQGQGVAARPPAQGVFDGADRVAVHAIHFLGNIGLFIPLLLPLSQGRRGQIGDLFL